MCCKHRIGLELNGLIRQRQLLQMLKCHHLDLAIATLWEQCLLSYCLFLSLYSLTWGLGGIHALLLDKFGIAQGIPSLYTDCP